MDLNPQGSKSLKECCMSGLTTAERNERELDESGNQPTLELGSRGVGKNR